MSMQSIYTHRNERIRKEGLAENYKAYLETDLWATIRARVLKRDGGLCRICGGTATQCHHTNYGTAVLTGRSLVALFAICRSCHKFIEFNIDGRKAHLFKQVRDRILLLARIKGRTFIDPGRERRPCSRCGNSTVLNNLDDNGICRKCVKRSC
jgi:hypothetical protein